MTTETQRETEFLGRLPLPQRIDVMRGMVDLLESKPGTSEDWRISERAVLCQKTKSLVRLRLSNHHWHILDNLILGCPDLQSYYLEPFRDAGAHGAAAHRVMRKHIRLSLEILHRRLAEAEAMAQECMA
ncbi:hypothetical protein [Parvularcula sp. LCG005]|uniref:hypothetical protein n=1 Tax=Parvularcula sp. LCG005 TaxID=3078805 RepID=UPI0029427272|nr:hypothetical protein [Parvularcula sp. LCG005]WOI52578.1 hypothetical protein RUI03_10510 [Parvularcula sp. LCG005]